jgi:hypothetical protein
MGKSEVEWYPNKKQALVQTNVLGSKPKEREKEFKVLKGVRFLRYRTKDVL